MFAKIPAETARMRYVPLPGKQQYEAISFHVQVCAFMNESEIEVPN